MCAASASASPARKSSGNGHKTQAQHKIVAEHLANGSSIKSAMLAAGYSPSNAKQGKKRLPRAVMSELAEHDKHLVELGRTMDADHQENLARGRLRFNVIAGKDDGYNSAKLLGQDKRVNMFAPDTAVGLIVIQPPDKLPAIPSAAELPPAPVDRPKRLKP